jgi:adenine-specific DNA-methyltransferase
VDRAEAMTKTTKLELTWVGKENHPRLEPRILLEDATKSYHAKARVTENDIFENRLISGDNLLALKSLEQKFAGEIKCVYIDPPFNTQQALEHYDDGIEHSIWLSLMRDRLELLRNLLAEDGTLFVHIDDNELGYLIVLLDEIFGRANRLYVVTFRQASPTGHKAINPGCVSTSNFILIYAKKKDCWVPNRIFTARERDPRYTQFIPNPNDDYRQWQIATLMKGFANHHGVSEKIARSMVKDDSTVLDTFVTENAKQVIQLARPDYENVGAATRTLIDESGKQPEKIFRLERDGYSDIYLIGGKRILFYSDKLKVIDGKYVTGEPLTTIWDDVLSNNLHNEGGVAFPKGKKPEALIKRVLELSTQKGDWVLDSFAGSGTTGAVAQKMHRKWIMVELGEQCDTHIVPRLKRVIDGEDASGITGAVQWKGGGGFRYHRLASSLLEKDKFGNWIISRQYNATMLAEAMCKFEGFKYAPSDTEYWMHGSSTERDFIYVTTQTLSRDQLQKLSDDVGENRSLLVCCSAFRVKDVSQFPNLTIKKIPKIVLNRCEWGRDDYSLEIKNLPEAPPPPQPAPVAPTNGRRKTTNGSMNLFETAAEGSRNR